VLAQVGRAIFGSSVAGHLAFNLLQVGSLLILVLAANTSFADFPRLASFHAQDRFLPRQLARYGDRLVFSNGVLFLAAFASVLLIAFRGITTLLIALYAVGVFTSFTLSQAGMVARHRKLRQPGWRRNMTLNAVGAAVTFVVVIIVSITKFTVGAWLPIVVVPVIVGILLAIRSHYDHLERALAITPAEVKRHAIVHTVVVLVGRVHKGVVQAVEYARSLRPNHLTALYVAYEDHDREAMEDQWRQFGFDVPLEVVTSPYRELPPAVEKFLDELDERWHNDTITVIIPEFVAGRLFSPTQLLHNQSAGALKLALLFRENTVVTSVPYHVGMGDSDGSPASEASTSR
jgi:hypothetical protein